MISPSMGMIGNRFWGHGVCQSSLRMIHAIFLPAFLLVSVAVNAQSPVEPGLDLWGPGTVFDISLTADESAYAVGFFSLADRSPASGLIRIQPDGNLDPSFRPQIVGSVLVVQSLADGDVLLGGGFSQINGIGVGRLARLNSDGGLVTSWSVSADDSVQALFSQGPDLYVGGRFAQVNGLPRAAIARVSLDTASVDPGFAPIVNGAIFDVAVDNFGNVWLGGDFDEVNGQPTENLVVLDTDGAVVKTFDSDGIVRSIAFDAADRVYVCGNFSIMNGQERTAVARFSVGSDTVLDGWQIATDGNVFRCLADPGGLWLGGDMGLVNGLERRGVARIGADGTVDPGFAGMLSGVYVGNPGSSARVLALASSSNSALMVGGLLTAVHGQAVAGLATLDSTFGDLLRGYELERRAEIRSAVAQLADGSLLIGGTFRRAGEIFVNNLARIDADGQIDPDWPLGADGPVLTALSLPDGSVILGGFFSSMGGEPRLSLARLVDPIAGQLDEIWRPEVYGSVHVLHDDACASDDLYVGGFFRLGSNSVESERINFKKFELSGMGEPADFGVSFDGQVNAIVQPSCDHILIGGLFSEAQGLQRRGLAKVSITEPGLVDGSFNANLNGSVWSLLVDTQSDSVFMGGEFTQTFGQTRNRIAKFGTSLSSWNPGANGVPVALALDGLGGLYSVGTFTRLGGSQRLRIAKLSTTHPAVLDSFNPGSDGPILWGAQIFEKQLVVTGEFTTMGGLERRAIARFEVPVLRPDPIFFDRFQQDGTEEAGSRRIELYDACADSALALYGPLEEDQPFFYPPCEVH